MFEKEQSALNESVSAIICDLGLMADNLSWSWIPFSGHWGFATSLFKTAAKNQNMSFGLSVKEYAILLANNIKQKLDLPREFDRVEAVNGYLNFYLNPSIFAEQVVTEVLSSSDNYGMGQEKNKRIMVEYSQPNTHKAFHVGHLRNMVLGSSICRIIECAGNEVIRANYIGDIGLHVIKWLWHYLKEYNGEVPPGDQITRWMGDIYAQASKKLEENPELENEIRDLFQRWDARDPQIVELWQKTRQWSLDAFQEVYRQLGIKFDRFYFESEVEDSGKKIVDNLIKCGIAVDERPEGAVIVDLDRILGTKDKYKVLVILRSDGTSLYPTKDIPLAIQKFEEHELDQSIYVIDVRQSLYLKQIFKLLEIMGFMWADKCYHLSYEIVNLPGNVTVASREGTVVLLEDLISEAEKRALRIVEEKNPDLGDNKKNEIAHKVAIGAIKYSLLSRDNTKIITFDWDAAMDVNGQAAPYIQYAYVRANSILKKAHFSISLDSKITHTLSNEEIELIDLIARLPEEVQKAAKELKPLQITNYSYELAKAFSDFYNQCPVLSAEKSVQDFRLKIVAAFRQTIKNSLDLLGIQVPDVM